MMFVGVLSDYISINLEEHIPGTINLFEKPREINPDTEMKFTFIAKYNELQDKLVTYKDTNGDFELGVVCDVFLDLLRHQDP